MDTQQNRAIIMYGPTGVGKSDFAIELARAINGEIINADVGQFYTPLSIGTAKPDWQTSDIKHHLFDIVDDPVNITIVRYRNLVQEAVREICLRGKVPIIVGGSGFYLRALLFAPIEFEQKNKELSQEHTSGGSWDDLFAIDPDRALVIHQNDHYRIARALAIWRNTGVKPSTAKPLFDPLFPYYIFFVTRDREHLYERINARVLAMLQSGWCDEVAHLLNTPWCDFLLEKKIIGYDDIIHFLQQPDMANNIKTMVDVICTKTRNYAKRQYSFWRSLQRDLDLHDRNCYTTLNLDNTASDELVRACVLLLHDRCMIKKGDL